MSTHNRSMALIGGGALGIVGALVAWDFAIIGVPLMLVAAGLIFSALRRPKISPQMKIVTPEQKERAMMKFLGPEPDVKRLLAALHAARLPSRRPVFVGEDDETIKTVQDVLADMVEEASKINIPLESLIKHAPALYERIFPNLEAACQKAPTDVDEACRWLAHRALMDMRHELVSTPVLSKLESMLGEMIDK